MAFLSAVKDGATGEILAHHFSSSLKMDLVYRTLEKLESVTKDIPETERYLHSDQGSLTLIRLSSKMLKKWDSFNPCLEEATVEIMHLWSFFRSYEGRRPF